MAAYYNEFDKKAAAWLRELIKAGHIADGEVDERSIEDVVPSELTGYTQCHFFAGIGVWSYALRQAGWPDDRPVWTGSCPCQPFSAAGKGGGFDDERHLWPAFHHLISQCRPGVVFGEQVASKDGLAWLDLVQADLEGTGYAVGAVDICAAGFGAPHIRQRLYWVADAQSSHGGLSIRREESGEKNPQFKRDGAADRMADTEGAGEQRESRNSASTRSQGHESIQEYGQPSSTGFLADPASNRRREGQSQPGGCASGDGAEGAIRRTAQFGIVGGMANAAMYGHASAARPAYLRRLEQQSGRQAKQDECVKPETECHTKFGGLERAFPGPVNGFWADADWLFCRDNKWRSVESGTFPLVDGAPARVGRLRGFGNALVAPQAQAFIEAYLDAQKEG